MAPRQSARSTGAARGSRQHAATSSSNAASTSRTHSGGTSSTANPIEDDDSMDIDIIKPLVKIKTNDGKRFSLTESDITCSNTLRRMMQSSKCSSTGSSQSDFILLPTISSETLDNILFWSQKYCRNKANFNMSHDAQSTSASDGWNPAICSRGDMNIELSDMDKTFMSSFSETSLLELMHVANYLDVRCLFNACCQSVAKRWENKKVDEIRRMYGIVSDFSQDEEYQMIQESRKFGLNE